VIHWGLRGTQHAKANGAITLSSKAFLRLNAELSAEWDRIKAELKI